MSDRTFFIKLGPYKLSHIIDLLDCNTNQIYQDTFIHDIKPLNIADEKSLTFFSNKKYIPDLYTCNAAACLVPLDFNEKTFNLDMILLKTSNPYHSYSKALDIFYKSHKPSKNIQTYTSPSAYIANNAKIGKNCYIGHNVVINDKAEIGDDCIIESGTFIDFKVKIGKDASIGPNVSISYSVIGNNFIALPGVCIGQEGFGFSTNKGEHKKILHTGRVIIGNNVELGANSTIDRGSIHDTILEDWSRIDNLVHVGHNVHIKKGTIIAAQSGVAGSSQIGSYCIFGGQVGISGHVTIADGVQISGQGGVIQDIKDPGVFGGTPAVPIKDWHKQTIIIKKLIKGKVK